METVAERKDGTTNLITKYLGQIPDGFMPPDVNGAIVGSVPPAFLRVAPLRRASWHPGGDFECVCWRNVRSFCARCVVVHVVWGIDIDELSVRISRKRLAQGGGLGAENAGILAIAVQTENAHRTCDDRIRIVLKQAMPRLQTTACSCVLEKLLFIRSLFCTFSRKPS
jgi:hypothetical protein